MFSAMFTGFTLEPAHTLTLLSLLDSKTVVTLLAALFFAFGVPQAGWKALRERHLLRRLETASAALGYSALFGVSVITLAGATFNPFIYFQF